MPHVIRLRDHWTVTGRPGGNDHVRKFGRPGRLAASERVWLVLAHVPGPAEVSLNGRMIGALADAGRFEADVTGRLAERNTVAVSVASTEALGEVTVEVRS
jgi:hypothetical protein